MKTTNKYLKKDRILKNAIKKVRDKINSTSWRESHKIDPNNLYDLEYRLRDKAWDNCFECLEKHWPNGYRLEKKNELPYFTLT